MIAAALIELGENQRRIALVLEEMTISLAGNRAATSAVARVVDEQEAERQVQKAIEYEKDVFTHIYSRAQAYSKIIILGFYGIYFGLYNIVKDIIGRDSLYHSVLLMIASATLLALFEVASNVYSNWSAMVRLSKLEKPIPLTELGQELSRGQALVVRHFKKVWLAVLVFCVVTALASDAIFMSIVFRALH